MAVLKERIKALVCLGDYLAGAHDAIDQAIQLAYNSNGWFDESNTRLAIQNICSQYLQEDKLWAWTIPYNAFISASDSLEQEARPLAGLIMAGNIPLVGFHDFLCVYIAGFNLKVKFSSKDIVLWNFIFNKMASLDQDFKRQVSRAEMLKGCNAYIATGSNNSARYFEYYFSKYPHIIRRNRTSVAVLDGNESVEDLDGLAADICSYYGLGCRNVTQLFVPDGYDFAPLMKALEQYEQHMDNHKYKNNYDYQLALMLLNKQPYIAGLNILLSENAAHYAPVSVLHYQYYQDKPVLLQDLQTDDNIQCIAGRGTGLIAFGASQQPTLDDYADGINTMQFLSQLKIA